MLKAEAKERMLAGASHGGRVKNHREECPMPKSAEGSAQETATVSREIAGRAVGVGRTTISTAMRIKREDPEEFERVKTGVVKLEDARRKVAGVRIECGRRGRFCSPDHRLAHREEHGEGEQDRSVSGATVPVGKFTIPVARPLPRQTFAGGHFQTFLTLEA